VYTFPVSDTQQPEKLLAALGSFWAETFADPETIRAYSEGVGHYGDQLLQDLTELMTAVSRHEISVYHTENWFTLTLRQSQLAQKTLRQYDGTSRYTGSYNYSVPSQAQQLLAPAALSDVRLISDQPERPGVFWVHGIDFTYTAPYLRLRHNPFEQASAHVQPVFDETGQILDRELTLWLFRGQFDRGYLFQQFGYVLGLRLTSSPAYKQLLNGIYDSLTVGTTLESLSATLTAITGVPLAASDEIVEQVFPQRRQVTIVTDRQVYQFAGDARPLVRPGDAVSAGTALTDTLQIFHLNRGQIPADLTALALGPGTLAGDYSGDLVFSNTPVPLRVITTPTGEVQVEFAVGGAPSDVRKFWNEVHRRERQRGRTLAQLLDVRGPQAATAPSAASLPAVINPLAFLLRHVIRANALLVRLKLGSERLAGTGLPTISLLRKVLPPHVAVFLLVDLPLLDDSSIIDTVTETLDVFLAAPVLASDTGTVAGEEQIEITAGV